MSKEVTSCQSCAFSETELDDSGLPSQVGCSQNMLSKFNYAPAFNELGEFNVIDGICLLKRDQEWAENKSIQEMKELLKKESRINWICYIDCTENNLDTLKDTVRAALNQKTYPAKIVLIVRGFIYEPTEIQSHMDEIFLNELGQLRSGAWRVEQQVGQVTFREAVDRSLNHLMCDWYMLTSQGQPDLGNLVAETENNVFFENKECLVTEHEGSILINRVFHDAVCGNKQMNIEEKYAEINRHNNTGGGSVSVSEETCQQAAITSQQEASDRAYCI